MFDNLFEYCYKKTNANLSSDLFHAQKLDRSVKLLSDIFTDIDQDKQRHIYGHQLIDGLIRLEGVTAKDASMLLHYAIKTGIAEIDEDHNQDQILEARVQYGLLLTRLEECFFARL